MHDVVSSGTLLQGIVYLRKGKFERKKNPVQDSSPIFFSKRKVCVFFFAASAHTI